MTRTQFSLRTLLIVVTILAVPFWYVGGQYRIVQARKQLMEKDVFDLYPLSPRTSEIPWLRKILGDEDHPDIYAAVWVSDKEMGYIQEMFPEAEMKRIETEHGITELRMWPPPEK